MLERRLDVMCVRSHLYSTLKEAKQFIKNGLVMINNQIIKSCYYILKDKDVLTEQILRALPPYLKMNLHTFQIIFVNELFAVSKIPHFAFFPWQRFPNFRKKHEKLF